MQKITDLPWEVLTEAVYSNIKHSVLEKNDTELKRWLGYSWIYEDPTVKSLKPLPLVAAEEGNIDALEAMIDGGASIDVKDDKGKTLLYYGVKLKDDRLLKYLLREGADINEADEYEETPVFWAIDNYNPSKLETVVLFGGKVDVKNKYGSTPLHEAVYKGSRTLVEVLVDNGADLSALNSDKRTPRKLAKKLKYKGLKKYLKKKEKEQK